MIQGEAEDNFFSLIPSLMHGKPTHQVGVDFDEQVLYKYTHSAFVQVLLQEATHAHPAHHQ